MRDRCSNEVVRKSPFRSPPKPGHARGGCAIPKAVWQLRPAREKFLPFSNRPQTRHWRPIKTRLDCVVSCFNFWHIEFKITNMELSHFSEQSDIIAFDPRPIAVPVDRPDGQEWLNGPLVWAIDQPHSILYLFPRECPRIVVWPTTRTSQDDYRNWLGSTSARAVAFVEEEWLERIARATIFRYTMPPATFEAVGDIGMWVTRHSVQPSGREVICDLSLRLAAVGVELRAQSTLIGLKPIWSSTLHASGIRLRNANGWGAPGWPHSKQVCPQ